MTVSYLHSMGKLTMLHFGCQVKGQFDNDNPPLIGPEGLKETVFMFWALKKIGWKGVVDFDCHMLRAESDPAEYIECLKQFIRDCAEAVDINLALSDRIKDPAPGRSMSAADLDSIKQICGL